MLQYSDGYRNGIASGESEQQMFTGGEVQVYTGSPPSDPNAVATGTLLATYTLSGATRTPETRGTALLTLSGGGSGDTITSVTIDGYEILGATVNWTTSDANTATLIAQQINRNCKKLFKVKASASSATVTILGPLGAGTGLNGKTVAASKTGAVSIAINGGSSTTFGGSGATAGVASANGLTFDVASSGQTALYGTVQSTPVASGTAGYFRLEGVNSPTGSSPDDTTNKQYRRIQGTCGTSGADFIMNSTTITISVVSTITSGSITIPAS